ncbi:HNH endonuclease [Nostocoides jenkinsii]|uniref:Putative HNH endonuclease domain protein n=1 Tax=Nostocoides jenkinsii Ben 74 TaxID=1193518 RepID=A0A077MFI0_9MICO|nr:HNH endonuclease signature motif containing protein [Tetrasphaera jenkinsii]CCI53898.1 putative HNH endonuclease domain protein [Tetrasphaera jenkinsii Ben 74]
MTARAQHLTEGPRGAAAGPPVDDAYDGLGPIDDVWWLPLGADDASADLDARRDDFGWDDELHGLLDGDAWAFADSDETVTAVRDLIDWLATLVPDEPVGEAGVVGAAGLEGSPADLIDLIGGLERLKGAIAATQARATAAFAREVVRDAFARRASARKARSAIAPQIALARRCSPATADRYLALARALPGMPHTQAALTEGVIDERAAGAIVRETSVLTPELRARVDELIAPRLATSSLKQLAGAAARHAAELDPAAVVAKHERALSERGAWTRPAPDGMAYLSIFGPLTGIVGAYASLLRHATAVVAGHCETDSEESLADPLDGRTHAQVMSDTAIRWLSGVTPGQAVPVALNLVMPAEALFATDDATTVQPSVRPPRSRETPARIPGHGILPAALARRLLLHGCEAPDTAKYKPPERDSSPPGSPPGGTRLAEPAQVFLTRVFASPDGRDLLALDATARLFPPKLRAALIVRDDRCRTPYCDASIRHADHIQSANSGGPTSLSNGQGLCVRCNYTKELEGFSTRVLDEHHVPGAGPNTHVTEVTTPTGHLYVSVAPPLLE